MKLSVNKNKRNEDIKGTRTSEHKLHLTKHKTTSIALKIVVT